MALSKKSDPNTSVGPAGGTDEGKTPRNVGKDLGDPNPDSMRAYADDLPEKDAVQKAYKRQLKATSAQDEAKAKVTIVEESPDAGETPSGYALKKVAGETDDTKRGERYAQEKSARRWGYVPAE